MCDSIERKAKQYAYESIRVSEDDFIEDTIQDISTELMNRYNMSSADAKRIINEVYHQKV